VKWPGTCATLRPLWWTIVAVRHCVVNKDVYTITAVYWVVIINHTAIGVIWENTRHCSCNNWFLDICYSHIFLCSFMVFMWNSAVAFHLYSMWKSYACVTDMCLSTTYFSTLYSVHDLIITTITSLSRPYSWLYSVSQKNTHADFCPFSFKRGIVLHLVHSKSFPSWYIWLRSLPIIQSWLS